MVSTKWIPAVYGDGVLKLCEPVRGVAEHECVSVMIYTEEALTQRAVASECLARASIAGLTAEQYAIIAGAALDQEHGLARSQ